MALNFDGEVLKFMNETTPPGPDAFEQFDKAWEENDKQFRQAELNKTMAQYEAIKASATKKPDGLDF